MEEAAKEAVIELQNNDSLKMEPSKDSIEIADNGNGNIEVIEKPEKEPDGPKEGKQRKKQKSENKSDKMSEKDFKILSIKKTQSHDNLLKIIKLIAPGTALRTAIADIVRVGKGALIVVDSPGLDKIIEGGFRVNCMFTPQRLVELSKMDGAIIISSDMKKILSANTLLAPSISMPTKETGTRHKAAERTARQLKTLTIAVSERRKTVTLFHDELRYILKSSSEILRRSTESLQILEKQCEIFEEVLLNLNVLEFTNLTNLNDVCMLIQRAEIILKIASIIKREIIELGREGVLIKMRLRELVKDIEKEELLVISDYTKLKAKRTKSILEVLSFEELLELSNIIISLGYTQGEAGSVTNKGYRILDKTELTTQEIIKLVKDTKSLNKLLETPLEDLIRILKSEKKASKLQKDLIDMKEQVMLGKKI